MPCRVASLSFFTHILLLSSPCVPFCFFCPDFKFSHEYLSVLRSSCSQSFQVREVYYLKEFSPAGLVSPEISEWLALPPTADTGRRERHATATTTHPTRPTARPSRAAHISRTRTSHQRPSGHRTWRAAPRSARQLDSRSLSRLAAAANWVCLNAGTRRVPTKLSSGCSKAKLTQKSFFYV